MEVATPAVARNGNPGIVPPHLRQPTPPNRAVPAPHISPLSVSGAEAHDHQALQAIEIARGANSNTANFSFATRLDLRHVIDRGDMPGDASDAERQAARSTLNDVQKMFTNIGVKAYEGNGPGMRVIFNSSFPNAAYVPEEDVMIIGRSPSGKSFAFAKDVIAHEYSHRVADFILRIEPAGESGAVNESLADTYAAAVDTDDWMVAEDVVSGGVRDMLHPERPQDAVSIDGGPKKPLPGHMKDYMTVHADVDQGGVHLNMGIPNKAAALIGEKLGRQTMAQIYLDAMRNHMGPLSTIASTAKATMRATSARFGTNSPEMKTVVKAWDAVGIVEGAS